MTLVIDMGNSDIVLGVFNEEGTLIASSRTSSALDKSRDEYVNTLKGLLLSKGINPRDLKHSLLSSVVPPLTRTITSAMERLTGVKPILLAPGVKTGLALRVDNPLEVGADLIADCVGAIKKHGYPCIVVDLGTATKICMVNDKGEFVGCVIIPGLKVAAAALSKKASKLPNVACVAPEKVIGKNTFDSMNSGIVYGHAAMVDGFIARFRKEEGYDCKVVATGGLVNVVIPHCETADIVVDKTVILEGLYEIYLRTEKDRQRKEAKKNAEQ